MITKRLQKQGFGALPLSGMNQYNRITPVIGNSTVFKEMTQWRKIGF
jgi:hypothetical protein